jgi:D-alanine-D-alanine ligase
MTSSRIRIAVLRGGPSHEYEASLKTGGHVLSLLREMPDKYEPVDIFVSKDGEWHYWGLVRPPEKALKHVDVVWNALHGPYGEDGRVQEILEGIGLPFTGSSRQASMLAMDKTEAKKIYFLNGVSSPRHELFSEDSITSDRLFHVFRNYLYPVIVKPADLSGSLGVRKVQSYAELEEAIRETLHYSPRVMVEEMVRGREVSCAVVDGARGQNLYAFMPVEIGPEGRRCPSGLGIGLSKQVEDAARQAHQLLGMRHYSISDFLVTTGGKIYILETNALPHLGEDSLMHQSFEAAGWQERDFIDHVVELAMHKRMEA